MRAGQGRGRAVWSLQIAVLGVAAGVLAAAPATVAETGALRQACDLSVMISGAFNAPYQKLAQPFETARHKALCTANGPSMGDTPQAIPNRLARGEPADVVIVARSALDGLVAKGEVVRGSEVDLVRSPIGMAVRKGAPKPDISTSDRFKAALLEAKSIAYSDSASGVYIGKDMYRKMGLEAQLAPKSKAIPATPVGIEVAQGRAEIGFQQISELLPIPGIEVVGPIPEPWQHMTVFSAGVAKAAKHPEEARALIRYLASRQVWPTIRATGLEPAGALRK
jgi:molybdate transport system substrate-binding protein